MVAPASLKDLSLPFLLLVPSDSYLGDIKAKLNLLFLPFDLLMQRWFFVQYTASVIDFFLYCYPEYSTYQLKWFHWD